MAFYDLSKEERAKLTTDIQSEMQNGLAAKAAEAECLKLFSNEDIYIRKAAYLGIGRIYKSEQSLRRKTVLLLNHLKGHANELVRQTVVNAAGEIGISDFEMVQPFFDEALFDVHHKVRNAVIGSLKKISQKNPLPSLSWAKSYLNHPDKEVRREICHGIELRGRTHPEDILPLLKILQNDDTRRVRDTLVHVIGQISYKKDCLPKVASELKKWKNKQLVADAVVEIIDVHSEKRYAKFAALSQEEAVKILADVGC